MSILPSALLSRGGFQALRFALMFANVLRRYTNWSKKKSIDITKSWRSWTGCWWQGRRNKTVSRWEVFLWLLPTGRVGPLYLPELFVKTGRALHSLPAGHVVIRAVAVGYYYNATLRVTFFGTNTTHTSELRCVCNGPCEPRQVRRND